MKRGIRRIENGKSNTTFRKNSKRCSGNPSELTSHCFYSTVAPMQNFSRLVDIARAFRLEKKTGRSFHVTFALRHGKPISIGFNNFKKSNKISHGYKPYNTWHLPSYRACVHAECDCVAKIKHLEIDRGRITIVSVRIDNDDRVTMAKPCPNCAYLLGKSGYTRVFYSDYSGEFVRLK